MNVCMTVDPRGPFRVLSDGTDAESLLDSVTGAAKQDRLGGVSQGEYVDVCLVKTFQNLGIPIPVSGTQSWKLELS